VDSGSVDRTREIAEATGARVVRLLSEDFTFGHSLNVGIRESRGAFIAILSAHAIPTDELWLERLVRPLRQPGTAMVFGGQRGHDISLFSEARDFERVFPSQPQWMIEEHSFVNNANSAVRRDLWEQHPFDEGLPGLEDGEWAKHWLWRDLAVRYEPEACIIHVHSESWTQIRHRFHREGMAGRWAHLRLVRHIPREVCREVLWCFGDLWLATRQRRLPTLAGQIVRYRYHKTLGIVGGILDSRKIDNPSQRAELLSEWRYPAVVIRGPHDASIQERVIPPLKPSEILVRVAYEGICGTDLEIFEGRLGYYKSGMAKYPIVPGHETSGTVVSIGKKVTTLREGNRVVVECIQGCGTCPACNQDNAIACRERREVGVIGVDGGYAAYLVTRARYAHVVPDNVTLAQAALVEPLAVVIKALRRLSSASAASEPRRCAVIGAGAIGNLAARVLALRGHDVMVFDKEQARLDAFDGIAATSSSLGDLGGFDWIIEATGDQSVLSILLEQSRTGATLLLLGFPYEKHSFSFESIVGFDRTVVGSVGSSGADFVEALRLLPLLDTSPLLQVAFRLEEYALAWRAVRAREHVKVMLRVDPTAS
jgi:2-desacetyl-2-hydroxyethyl bacteriochlorophyllide A dehydrogenase